MEEHKTIAPKRPAKKVEVEEEKEPKVEEKVEVEKVMSIKKRNAYP